jgi:hypothetical protein
MMGIMGWVDELSHDEKEWVLQQLSVNLIGFFIFSGLQ